MQPKIKDAAIPSKIENLLYFIIGLFISIIGNFSYFAQQLVGDSLYVSRSLEDVVDLYIQEFLNFFDGLAFAPASAVFIFWSIAGIISFSILQSFLSVVGEIKNDIDVTTHYLHPRNYAKMSFITEVLLQSMAHTMLYFIVIVAGLLMGSVLAPIAINLLQSILLNFTFELLFMYVASLIILWFGITVTASCVRLLFMRKQMSIN